MNRPYLPVVVVFATSLLFTAEGARRCGQLNIGQKCALASTTQANREVSSQSYGIQLLQAARSHEGAAYGPGVQYSDLIVSASKAFGIGIPGVLSASGETMTQSWFPPGMGAKYRIIVEKVPLSQPAEEESNGVTAIPLGSVIVTPGHAAPFDGVVKVGKTEQLIVYDANGDKHGWYVALIGAPSEVDPNDRMLTLKLTPTTPVGDGSATIVAPGKGLQHYTLYYLDTRAFAAGGVLNVEFQIAANSATDGSFDLFPLNARIPTTGKPGGALASRHDVRKGTSTRLEYRFNTGQVFVLGLDGNWFSQKGATGTVRFRVSIANIHTEAPTDSQPPSGVRFSRPNISGIQLNQQSLDRLKTESEQLRLAGATKELLAWSPLIELTGENNAVHAAFSIQQTNWEELAKSFSAVDATLFYSLATDARNFANSDATWGNPKLKQFWNAMADFYASEAPER